MDSLSKPIPQAIHLNTSAATCSTYYLLQKRIVLLLIAYAGGRPMPTKHHCASWQCKQMFLDAGYKGAEMPAREVGTANAPSKKHIATDHPVPIGIVKGNTPWRMARCVVHFQHIICTEL